jgi:ABC-type dipeptide/oligopeptide/nickel transport system permease subunit
MSRPWREPRRGALGLRAPDPALRERAFDGRPGPAIGPTSGWWLGVFPGLFIMITVLSINFLGDALRDMLDLREAKDLARA